MSYATEVQVHDDPKFYGNLLVFETPDEAAQYGRDKVAAWLLAVDYRVVETDKPPNYRYSNNQLAHIDEKEA